MRSAPRWLNGASRCCGHGAGGERAQLRDAAGLREGAKLTLLSVVLDVDANRGHATQCDSLTLRTWALACSRGPDVDDA